MALDTSKRDLTIQELVGMGYSETDAAAKYDELVAVAEGDTSYGLMLKIAANDGATAVHKYVTSKAKPSGSISTDPNVNDTVPTVGGNAGAARGGRAQMQEYSSPLLQEAQESALEAMYSESNVSDLLANATSAKIPFIILGADPKRDYLKDASTNKPVEVVLTMDAKKLGDYKEILEDTEENRKAYAEVVEMINGKKTAPAFINTKAVGSVLAITFQSKLDGNKPVTLSYNTAMGYAINNFLGIVAPTKDTAGFRMKKMFVKSANATGSASEKAQISGVVVGRLAAVEAGNYKAAYRPLTQKEASATGLSSNVMKKKIPTEKTFRIRVKNADATKPDSIRTVRVKGEFDSHPIWTLAKEFEGIVNPPSQGRIGNCTVPTTKEQVAAQLNLLKNIMRAAVNNDTDASAIATDTSFRASLDAISKKAAATNTAGINV